MIKMAAMKRRILFLTPILSLLSLFTQAAQAQSPAFDIAELRAKISGLPGRALLTAARTASPANCLALLSDFQRTQPRRPAPWLAYRAQSACALAANDRSQALTFARAGLALRGSDSDLLVFKALASEPELSEARVEALTEALVFNRFENVQRLRTIVVLSDTFVRMGQGARAAALLERWVGREPGVQALLVEAYVRIGNRVRAVELSAKYLGLPGNAAKPRSKADSKAGAKTKSNTIMRYDLLRARARALLLSGDRVLSRAEFQEALALLSELPKPHSVDAVALQAQALLKLGQPQEAITVLEAAMKSNAALRSPGPLYALLEQARDELASQS